MSYLQLSMLKELGTISISTDGFLASVTDSSSYELFRAWIKSAKQTVIELVGDGEVSVTDLRISVKTGNLYVHSYVRDALGLRNDLGYLYLPSLVVPDEIACEIPDSNMMRIISAFVGGTIRKVLDMYFISESKDSVYIGMEHDL